MDKVNGKLTVFFEEPFWVGIFERIEDGKLSVAKVTFGAEPKDYEVQEYIQKCYFSLKFSPVVETVVKDIKRNPKRMQRKDIQSRTCGIHTSLRTLTLRSRLVHAQCSHHFFGTKQADRTDTQQYDNQQLQFLFYRLKNTQ